MPNLVHLPEPPILFDFGQAMFDPRDGLMLFGPLDRAKPEGIRWAAVGPPQSLARIKRWIGKIASPVVDGSNQVARPPFPGFEAAFRTRCSPTPVLELPLDEKVLHKHAHNADKYQRVYRTVDLYADRIKKAVREEDAKADVWCVVIPEYVYQNCRPKSSIPAGTRIEPEERMSPKFAKGLATQPSLFSEMNTLAVEYQYEVNFHHQLKARLLEIRAPTQVIREMKVAPEDFTDGQGTWLYPLENQLSAIAWNLSTAIFYKAGGRPWKLGAGRDGVCYIGLVFKQVTTDRNSSTACCGAQMFLDSGDGLVFRGAVGPWYRGKVGLFHMSRQAAREIVEMCVQGYAEKSGGKAPKEVFIHGRVALDNEEWAGFQEGAGTSTHVVGVRIRPTSSLKLYRKEDHPVLRGIAYLMGTRKAFLWTRGLVPRLRTYPGREVPNPILVDVCRGEADLQTVLSDVMALTKLNYNSCTYADGVPVTLKFANAVGEILTSGPQAALRVPPLPFKYYI